MAIYAFIDEKNVVTNVIEGPNKGEIREGISDWEAFYTQELGQRCIYASFNDNTGDEPPTIGAYYNEIKNKFVYYLGPDDWYFLMGANEFFNKNMTEFIAKPNLRFLEIGSYKGVSAVEQIKNVLTGINSTITCVDSWEIPDIEEFFDRETLPYVDKITKVKSDSKIWLEQNQDKKFDFIYIDGDHSAQGIEADTRLSWAMLKVGGVMALDDVLLSNETEQANNAFIETIRDKSTIIENGYQVWLRKTQE
jgi:hypothetical protein